MFETPCQFNNRKNKNNRDTVVKKRYNALICAEMQQVIKKSFTLLIAIVMMHVYDVTY